MSINGTIQSKQSINSGTFVLHGLKHSSLMGGACKERTNGGRRGGMGNERNNEDNVKVIGLWGAGKGLCSLTSKLRIDCFLSNDEMAYYSSHM